MKTQIMIFALAVLFQSQFISANDESSSCFGSASEGFVSISGFCTNNTCNATVPDLSVSASGSCDNGVGFSASELAFGETLYFQCNAGSFSVYVSGQSVPLSGRCSDGHSFQGQAQMNGGFINGSCMEYGPVNASYLGSSGSVSGRCE